jgi:hypothetical protein
MPESSWTSSIESKSGVDGLRDLFNCGVDPVLFWDMMRLTTA